MKNTELDGEFMKNNVNGIALFSEKGEYISSNESFKKLLGVEEIQLKNKKLTEIFKEIVFDKLRNSIEQYKFFLKSITINNQPFSLFIFPVIHNLKNKLLVFLSGNSVDDIYEMKELLNVLIEKSPAGIFIYRDTFIFSNKAFEKITGYSKEELKNIKPSDIVHPKFREDVIEIVKARLSGKKMDKHYDLLTIITKTGEEKHLEVITTTIKYKSSFAGMGICIDRTEKVQLEKKLNYLYFHDEITGLPNRRKFMENLEKALSYARKNNHLIAVILIDIKDFKLINKKFGYETGDKVLKSIGENLKKVITDVDSVARVGDDKFAILIYAFRSFEKLTEKIDIIFREIETDYKINSFNIFIEIKMGVAVFPKDGIYPEDIYKNAEIALLKAKKTPGKSFEFFSKNLYNEITKILNLKEKIRKVIEKNNITIYYQPIVDLKTLQIESLEALFRLDASDGNIILPKDIIPVAEETGLIVELGEKILRSVLEFSKEIPEDKKLSVNISAVQLNSPFFDKKFLETLEETQVSPERIILEITETAIMENVTENIEKLKNIKNKGVSISIDDFGTGYSSLNYLKILPIDYLKIDKSFVQGIGKNRNDEMIVKTIISMAKNMNLQTVAEGIETEEQLKFLQENRCEYGQGYFFYKPITIDKVKKIID
ncbi:EAL domain-containing protein [Persephonella sp.]